jgi:hypothetical protein
VVVWTGLTEIRPSRPKTLDGHADIIGPLVRHKLQARAARSLPTAEIAISDPAAPVFVTIRAKRMDADSMHVALALVAATNGKL